MSKTVDRGSWHFKLAEFGGLSQRTSRTDLCTYFWSLVKGFGAALLAFVVVMSATVILALLPLVQIIGFIVHGVWVVDWIGALFLYLEAVFLFLFIAYKASSKTYEAITHAPSDTLIGAGYRSWKEKTCVLIDVRG